MSFIGAGPPATPDGPAYPITVTCRLYGSSIDYTWWQPTATPRWDASSTFGPAVNDAPRIRLREPYPGAVFISYDQIRAAVEQAHTDHYDAVKRIERWAAVSAQQEAFDREWNECFPNGYDGGQ